MISKFPFKPRLWPTVMTIPMLIILCALGNWQLDRLDWKLDLIEKLESRYDLPPVDLPENITDLNDWEYRHIGVSGRYLHMGEMRLYAIGPNGRPGYDLFTPLLTNKGHMVIINRGWVPEEMKLPLSRPETIISGEVQITGVLRKSMVRERFAPENDPERNQWYYGEVQAMATAQGLGDIFPMFIYADKGGKDYPIGGRTRLKLVNNHLDYALTWYGLAIALAVIYFIFTLRRREEE